MTRATAGAPLPFPDTEALLLDGGDSRLAIDPQTGLNRYGCAPSPQPQMAAFGSSTASTVSQAGFLAADNLRRVLADAAEREPAALTYRRELDRLRGELLRLCGLAEGGGVEAVFAASGTDLHLIASRLLSEPSGPPLLNILVEASETGSGVPDALTGRHFSARAALGGTVVKGEAVDPRGLGEVVSVPCRFPDGALRPVAQVEAEIEALVVEAARAGRRVLLNMVDVSKTGLISPSLHSVLCLRRRMPWTVEVLVDACQFRLAPATLRAYLGYGLMVAVTGSKFVGGPSFCAALLVPPATGARLRERTLPREMSLYSARAEWPRGWAAADGLDETCNYGLLLRWSAALEDLRRFNALPHAEVARVLKAFGEAVADRLDSDPAFERVETRPLDRKSLGAAPSWDHLPTIFPFILRHESGAMFTPEETQQVYRGLTELGCQLGQPTMCGVRDGVQMTALRLCAGARLADEALSAGVSVEAIIGRAMEALDKTALLAKSISCAGRLAA